jgi:hypothetical protein
MSMINYIPSGAYIIRPKDSCLVLGNANPNSAITTQMHVRLDERDEIQSRETQIWWIERVPRYEEDGEEEDRDEEDEEEEDKEEEEGEEECGIYTITHTSSGMGLVSIDYEYSNEISRSGHPIQQWGLQKILDDKDGLVI